MKCVRNKKTKKIIRVKDTTAAILVQKGIAVYTNKSAWKREVRDAKD